MVAERSEEGKDGEREKAKLRNVCNVCVKEKREREKTRES